MSLDITELKKPLKKANIAGLVHKLFTIIILNIHIHVRAYAQYMYDARTIHVDRYKY